MVTHYFLFFPKKKKIFFFVMFKRYTIPWARKIGTFDIENSSHFGTKKKKKTKQITSRIHYLD